MLASISGLSEVVHLLLSAGADVHLKDRLGLTAIEWSKRRGFLEVADLLENSAKQQVESTKTTMTSEKALADSASEIKPEIVVPSSAEPSRPVKQEGTAGKKRIQVDDTAKIQTQEPSGSATQVEAEVQEERLGLDDAARIQTQEPSGPTRLVEDKAEEERIRLDHVARIQALFDQLKVAEEKSTPREIELPRESGAPLDGLRTRSLPDEEMLRQERLKAEDERISRAHREKELSSSQTRSANLRSSQEQKSSSEPTADSVDAERAANELAREKSRLDAERLAEETRRRVEEEVRKRFQRQAQQANRIDPEPVKVRSQEAAKAPSRDGQRTPTESSGKESAKRVKEDQGRQTLPPRGMRIITQDIWPAQPVASVVSSTTPQPITAAPVTRCPKCNAAMEGESCPACANDQLSMLNVQSFGAPQANALARPTVWMLMSATLAGGVFIGYQLNEYVSRNDRASAPLVTAPVAQPVRVTPEVTPEPSKDTPQVSGALSGAEASIPEPEYPARAKSEGLSGKIIVRVRVNNRGRVILARSSTGDWRLRAAAVQAAKKATFLPEKLSADQRPVSGTITYTFKPSP